MLSCVLGFWLQGPQGPILVPVQWCGGLGHEAGSWALCVHGLLWGLESLQASSLLMDGPVFSLRELLGLRHPSAGAHWLLRRAGLGPDPNKLEGGFQRGT